MELKRCVVKIAEEIDRWAKMDRFEINVLTGRFISAGPVRRYVADRPQEHRQAAT